MQMKQRSAKKTGKMGKGAPDRYAPLHRPTKKGKKGPKSRNMKSMGY